MAREPNPLPPFPKKEGGTISETFCRISGSPSLSGEGGGGRGPSCADLNLRRLAQRLVDNTVALRQADQRGKLLLARVGVQIEEEANLLEADRRLLRDGQRATEVQLALHAHRRIA